MKCIVILNQLEHFMKQVPSTVFIEEILNEIFEKPDYREYAPNKIFCSFLTSSIGPNSLSTEKQKLLLKTAIQEAVKNTREVYELEGGGDTYIVIASSECIRIATFINSFK